MLIKKEQNRIYKYKFEATYSDEIIGLARELRDKYGKSEFYFMNKGWRFNYVDIMIDIIKKYRFIEIDYQAKAELKFYIEEKKELADIKLSKNDSIYKLRNYQEMAVKRGVNFYRKKEKGGSILVLPAGSGKSIVLASIAKELEGNTLVLQPSKEILMQNYGKAVEYGFNDIGIFSASCGRKDIGKITFATIGSIIKKKELFKDVNSLLVDECHLISASGGMYSEFIKFFGDKVLGVTATPYRLHNYLDFQTGDKCAVSKFLTRTRPRIFNKILHITQVDDLYKLGFLCKIKYSISEDYNHSEIKLNSTGANFDETALKLYNEKKGIIRQVEDAIMDDDRKHILTFCTSIADAKKLTDDLNVRGMNSAVISSKMKKKDREKVLEDFQSGKIHIVNNVGILTCLSDDTEILTDNGWCGINDMSKDKRVAQYNVESEEITFCNPLRIINRKLSKDDKMVILDGRYVSIGVTLDHDMLAANSHGRRPKKVKAGDIVNRKVFIPVSGYSTPKSVEVIQAKGVKSSKKRFIIYNSYNYRKNGETKDKAIEMATRMWYRKKSLKYKEVAALTLNECRFIGFFLGDGSAHRLSRGGGIRYSLSQSLGTPKMLQWIEDLLHSCKINFSYKDYSGGQATICGRDCMTAGHRAYSLSIGTGGNKQCVDGLYRLIPFLKKEGSNFLYGLNRKQYFCLMEGLWKADGWHGDNKKYRGGKITGEYKELFDILQAVGVCRGFRVTIKEVKKRLYNKKQLYNISLYDKRMHKLTNDLLTIKTVGKENSRVWCVTTKEGTIVTRRNGTVTIMGNCGFDFPALDCIVLARPTQSLALYYQIFGRGMRICEGKKDVKIIDLCGNVKRFGRVETFKIIDPKNGLHILVSNVGAVTGVNMAKQDEGNNRNILI